MLTEVPEGSIPVKNIDYTKSQPVNLSPYKTEIIEVFFYFPKMGNFSIYPANVAKDGQVYAVA